MKKQAKSQKPQKKAKRSTLPVAHYFSKKQTAKENKQEITGRIRGVVITCATSSAMFSPSRFDLGSILLAEAAEAKRHEKILDLGCGYGLIGISLKKTCPEAEVTLVDINARAIKYAHENAKRNNVDVNIIQSDGCEKIKDKRFTLIVSNPPFSAGKKVWQKMLTEGRNLLEKKGRILVVGRKSKGGKALLAWLQDNFGHGEVVKRGSGYQVYCSRPGDSRPADH